jgi:hypothetical protein
VPGTSSQPDELGTRFQLPDKSDERVARFNRVTGSWYRAYLVGNRAPGTAFVWLYWYRVPSLSGSKAQQLFQNPANCCSQALWAWS